MKPTFVRPASREDILTVGSRLRKADAAEVRAVTGMDPTAAFLLALEAGQEVRCAGLAHNDRAEILFGADAIEDMPYTAATIWLVSTDVVYDHPVEFAVNMLRLFEDYHKKYEYLGNFIDARNTRHQKFLKKIGFIPLRRFEKFGAESLPFIQFASFRPCA